MPRGENSNVALEQKTSGNQFPKNSGASFRYFGINYRAALLSLFSFVVILSVTDYLTTSIALADGLREGNALLLGLASSLGLTFFTAIAATKLAFILGSGLLVFLGIKSDALSTKKLIIRSMLAFVILLVFVSANNLAYIL